MIDSQQLQQLLKTTKLNSISDVIQFILDQLYKIINFQPIQQLSLRIAQLEKPPQGLDKIQLLEVKELIEVMLQQKQQQIRRDLQKTVHSNLSMALQHEHTRRSLRQIDLLQLMANQNSNANKRTSLTSQQKSTSLLTNQQIQLQLDTLKKQINQIKSIYQKKLQKRQFNDFKFEFYKQLSNKINITETEKIVQKFEKQIFGKLSETTTLIHNMQYQLKKILMNEIQIIKKQLIQNSKLLQLKQKIYKNQKKLKKHHTQFTHLFQQTLTSLQKHKRQSKQSLQQLCNLIQNIDTKYKQTSQYLHKIQQQQQYLKQIRSNSIQIGSWLAQNNIQTKNNSISWQKQLINQNSSLYKYQNNKTQIIVTQSGFYNIQCYVNGTQKSPELTINGQGYYQLETHHSNKGFIFVSDKIMKINQNTKISIKLQNSSNSYNCALIKISKIG